MTIARRLTLALLLSVIGFGFMGCKVRARHFVRHGVQRNVMQDAQLRRQREVNWRHRVESRRQVIDRTSRRLRTR